ncbi:hypothetical protein GCM10022232_05720 [Streptomyces plumbiresistens]|uniref:DUF3291 domain-containing protein n=1 Tax=Streptomyces plumbiresistens TaxID=511811 RepID=A0ABP7Q695_9ACTN
MRQALGRRHSPDLSFGSMTTPAAFELAQVNISRLKAPLDSPQLKAFVDALDPVNADAEAADGYVWRLQSNSGDATEFRVFDDD